MGPWPGGPAEASISSIEAAALGGEPHTRTEGLMHDSIHAAIATERVRDFVEAGETRRTIRRLKRERAQAAAAQRRAQKPELNAGAGRMAALLRLRPWVM